MIAFAVLYVSRSARFSLLSLRLVNATFLGSSAIGVSSAVNVIAPFATLSLLLILSSTIAARVKLPSVSSLAPPETE